MNLELLKVKRKQKGLTQQDMADFFSYTRQNFNQKELGKQLFKLSEIKELMSILELTPEEVIEIFID